MSYYVIRSTEDGLSLDVHETVEQVRKELFRDIEHIATEHLPVFLSKCPEVYDGQFENQPESAVLIIKGEIVVPKPVKRVTEWEIE